MKKRITVELDPSTLRWLQAFARSQGGTLSGTATAESILAQAAFCIADYAGRRPGSWEADVAGNMMIASGWQDATAPAAALVCKLKDARP